MAYCCRCGAELNGVAKFCPKCGNSIDGGNVQGPNSIDKGVNITQKKSKTIPVLVIILVLLLLGGFGWYFSINRGNKYSLEKLALVTNGMDIITDFHEGLAFFEKGEKLGVVNKLGDIIVEPKYDSELLTFESFYNDGMARVCKNGRYGFIDKEGKEIIPCRYEEADFFTEGLTAVKKDGKYGFLDKKGQEVIPFIYGAASGFSEGLSAVEKDGKYGFINKKGETIIPFMFDYAETFNGEATIASKNDKNVIINKEGKVVKEFSSGQFQGFSEGMALYENDEGKYGFVDEKGNLVIPCSYYAVNWLFGVFVDGYASVYKEDVGKFGIIDKSGKTILPFKFEVGNGGIEYSEGLFCAYEKDKAGYYDTNGKCVIPSKFDEAAPFSEGLAAVKQGDLWGFIDKTGKMVINPLFDEVRSFSDGLAVVKKNDRYGIVDKNGKSTFTSDELKTVNIQNRKSIENNEERYEEEYGADLEYEEESNNKQVDISPILYECQNEITAIQREIEDACRTFVILGSQDVDMYKYTQMKSTFLNGVSDLERKADRAFDRCARELKEAGYPDAVDKINEEKRQFHSAIYSLTTRVTQQTDMSY